MKTPTRRNPGARPSREAFFVRVVGPNDELAFVNVTNHIGKPLPFRKPKETLAMSVTDTAVSFSLLQVTSKSAARVADQPILIPRGTFSRAQRKLDTLPAVTGDVCVVEHEGDVHTFALERDSAGLTRLKWTDLETDEPVLTTTGRAVKLHLYLWSEAAGRPITVSFIGYIGKPGSADTLLRGAARVLYSMSGLAEFRILTGIEVVDVPPPANRYAATVASRRTATRAVWSLPVWLFSDADAESAPVASGAVEVEVDMENANPSAGRLLVHLTADETLEGLFDHRYRATMDGAVAELLRQKLGDEDVTTITYDVILGSVTEETVARIVDALKEIGGLDLTETRARPHPIA